jgi:hypothetical protein
MLNFESVAIRFQQLNPREHVKELHSTRFSPEGIISLSHCTIFTEFVNTYIRHENGIDMMESFFKKLKHEEVYLYGYETYEDVITRLPYFIKRVYNHNKFHSAPGYRSPNDLEELLPIEENNQTPGRLS